MSGAAGEFGITPETYDALVNWEKRLAHEEPFYRSLFEQVKVRKVLDAACGTGRHAAWFHSWAVAVEGADLDARMIDFCRKRHGQTETMRWVRRSYEQPAEPSAFDAVICVGNSLALADDPGVIDRTLAALLAALRPGGACVVQVLNVWRLPDGPTQWQKCTRVPTDDPDVQTRLIVKGVHRNGGRALIDLLDVRITPDGVTCKPHGGSFMGIRAEELRRAALAGGAAEIKLYGSFAREPYDELASPDLILVCRRG